MPLLTYAATSYSFNPFRREAVEGKRCQTTDARLRHFADAVNITYPQRVHGAKPNKRRRAKPGRRRKPVEDGDAIDDGTQQARADEETMRSQTTRKQH